MMKSKKGLILVLTLVALIFLVILPVMGEELGGELSSPQGWQSYNAEYGSKAGYWGMVPNSIYIHNIEYIPGLKTIIHFDNASLPSRYIGTWETNNSKIDIPFKLNVTVGGVVRTIGQGTLGYYRTFHGFPPTEGPGYQYYSFTEWNTTGLTGTHTGTFYYANCNSDYWINSLYGEYNPPLNAPTGYFEFYSVNGGGGYVGPMAGMMTLNEESPFFNFWNATKPSGLGITGMVNKTDPSGPTYSSRVFIMNPALGVEQIYTSEETINPVLYTFNVPWPSIRIAVLSGSGLWYNTTEIFNVTQPNGTIPGLYNVTFIVQEKSGARIPYAPVNFNVNERSYQGYTNSTGVITFLNVPGTASASVRVTAEGFNTYTGTFSVNHDITETIILSPPGVTVFLDVKDATYGNYLENVGVGIKNTTSGAWRNGTQPIGKLYFDTTGANYEYPLVINQTIVLAASKAGYRSASETLTIPSDRYTVTLLLVNINGTAPVSGNFTAVISTTSRTTGAVIPGASVAIQELGRMGATNPAGTVTFRNLPVGAYTVIASATGYQSTTAEISGSDQDTFMKVIRLLPEGCSVSESGVTNCGNATYPGASTGNQTGNEKAANAISVFLDNLVGIGALVFFLIGVYFVRKVFWS